MWKIAKVDSRQYVFIVKYISLLGQIKTEIKKTMSDADDRLVALNKGY